jgi:hypothetical protein
MMQQISGDSHLELIRLAVEIAHRVRPATGPTRRPSP